MFGDYFTIEELKTLTGANNMSDNQAKKFLSFLYRVCLSFDLPNTTDEDNTLSKFVSSIYLKGYSDLNNYFYSENYINLDFNYTEIVAIKDKDDNNCTFEIDKAKGIINVEEYSEFYVIEYKYYWNEIMKNNLKNLALYIYEEFSIDIINSKFGQQKAKKIETDDTFIEYHSGIGNRAKTNIEIIKEDYAINNIISNFNLINKDKVYIV